MVHDKFVFFLPSLKSYEQWIAKGQTSPLLLSVSQVHRLVRGLSPEKMLLKGFEPYNSTVTSQDNYRIDPY